MTLARWRGHDKIPISACGYGLLPKEPEQRSIELSDFAELYEAIDLILFGCKGGDEASQDFIGMEL